jgi:hypothetical protein
VPHDELEERAAREGLIGIHEAANELGRSVEWTQTRIGRAGWQLTTRTWEGRQWVEVASVKRMVKDVGRPRSPEQARLDHLQAVNRGYSAEAQELSRAIEQGPQLDPFEWYMKQHTSRPPEPPPEPGKSFFERFGGGRSGS